MYMAVYLTQERKISCKFMQSIEKLYVIRFGFGDSTCQGRWAGLNTERFRKLGKLFKFFGATVITSLQFGIVQSR